MQPFTPKIIFFDIDDTLSRDGVIAAHNQKTLEQLAQSRQHSHSYGNLKLVIATGRAKPFLPDDIVALHQQGIIDAIICKNGQYAYQEVQHTPNQTNNQTDNQTNHQTDNHSKNKTDSKTNNQTHASQAVISDYPLTAQQAEQIVSLCQQTNVIYKFESTTHIGWSSNSPEHEKIRQLIDENEHFIIDANFHKHNDVYQCSVFFADDNEKMQHVDFAKYGLKLVHWHQIGADILPINASKARAVQDVCNHFNVSPTECMAFGDGMNDIEMFNLVGYAVAMGDGKAELKACADIVTGTIEEHGIQQVLIDIGLVEG